MRLFSFIALSIFCFAASAPPAPAASPAIPAIVFQDDFEASAPTSPPPGWAMWGDDQYKIPANYPRDTTRPHAGAGCLRIHHPADTAGYLVSAPERAIQPKPGTIYTVTFWARASQPGSAHFRFIAYQRLRPFKDAPSPGALNFEAGVDWKEYQLSVREGLDFFADESRYLMLTFDAAPRDLKTTRTLWIDDVRVAAMPDPNPTGLLRETSLACTPLAHRLTPGERLEVTLDASRRERPTATQAGGVSFHRLCGFTGQPFNKAGDYTLPPALESAIRDLRLPLTRIYGVGDEPFGIEAALGKTADLCRRIGVAPARCVLELETQSAATTLTPEDWARAVRTSRERGYGFTTWEIANEPSAQLWGERTAFPTAEDFARHFDSVSRAIRAADPRARIGFDTNPGNTYWGNYLMKRLAGQYDFIAPHYYGFVRVRELPFEEAVLTENYRILDESLKVGALLRAYNPGRAVEQYDTEWGLHSIPPGKRADSEVRNANITGTLYRAVRLIYYAREGMLGGASGWEMLVDKREPGFAMLASNAPQQRTMLYWLYYYFNRHAGPWVLPLEGTAPWHQPQKAEDRERLAGPLTPVLATLGADGRELYLVAANGSWDRAVPCTIHLRNFAARAAQGVLLTHDDLEASPLLARKEDAVRPFPVKMAGTTLQATLPPHAVVFLTLTAAK